MLAALDVSYVIVGHSERRQLFGEDDETVNRKVRAVFRNGMTPIVCVGETLEERRGVPRTKVAEQIRRAFDGVDAAAFGRAVVAYEPIGRSAPGATPNPIDAGQVVEMIRATLSEQLSPRWGNGPGPVRRERHPGEHPGFMAHPEIDGALVWREPRSGVVRPGRQVSMTCFRILALIVAATLRGRRHCGSWTTVHIPVRA